MIPSEFGSALINHLWPSTVVVAIAWLLAIALRKNHARARYWVWMAASLKFLLPFSLLMMAGEWLRSLMATPIVAKPALANAMEQMAQPFAQAEFFDAASYPVATHHANWLLIVLFAVWICGALVVAIRFGRGWMRVYAAKRAAIRTGSCRSLFDSDRARDPRSGRAFDMVPARRDSAQDDKSEEGFEVSQVSKSRPGAPTDLLVMCTPALIEPGVVGIFRPVLLLPEGILERLTAEQMRAIVAHEMCHVLRRDNLTFAIHMVVEALFWFHPAVWWIGARLIEERERACDEAVLSLGGEPRDYADAIVSVCKLYVESPLTCVSGISGADLKKRIVRIMSRNVGMRMSLGRRVLLCAAALLAVAVPVVVGWGQVQAGIVPLTHPRDGARYAFEVATIKPSPNTALSWRIRDSLAPFGMRNASVNDMVRFAYGIKSDAQLVDAPGWLKTEHFDIQAKASDADVAAFDKLRFAGQANMLGLLMQSLLEDRFQLRARVETRDLPVYALVVDKVGIKMKEVTPDPPPTPGVAPAPGAHFTGFSSMGPNVYRAGAEQMTTFASWLSICYEVAGRPVVDETGLKGSYDFVLSGVSRTPPPPSDANASGTQAPTASLFTALPEQLGLKLVPVKAPMEVLVIDHIEQPSPN